MSSETLLKKVYTKDEKKYYAKEFVRNISKDKTENSSIILEDLTDKKSVVIPLSEFKEEFGIK